MQRINQILINLISNSLKFTMSGGITVSASVIAQEVALEAGLLRKKREFLVRIMVKDTGVGIREEDRGKIFKVLGKLERTSSINAAGIGLGLSTCKKIMKALGGSIHLNDHVTQAVTDSHEILDVDALVNNRHGTSIAILF